MKRPSTLEYASGGVVLVPMGAILLLIPKCIGANVLMFLDWVEHLKSSAHRYQVLPEYLPDLAINSLMGSVYRVALVLSKKELLL